MVLEYKPQGKRPRERPRKRCITDIEEDRKTLGVKDWREVVQDRDKWRSIVIVTKSHNE